MLWISRARRSSEFTWRTFIFSNNLPEEIAGRNSNLKHVGLNRAKYFRLRCTLCEAFSSNNKISKLESLETKKNSKTNENYMKCKLSMNKHCRGNVLCRSLTDCQRNQIILEKKHACGLQPMLLTTRPNKLACIFCSYALALQAGPRRWKICPSLPACAQY